ncbi:MAG: LPS export ABC transporter permease LptF [Micavibrio sp.]
MVFNRYLFKGLGIATVFIAVTLAMIIFLTQSLRFLELIIDSGASGAAFLLLTLLALPRFFEIILPIALMAAILFVYNRMTIDSELVVMKATGASPQLLARPALILSAIIMVILLIMTSWLGPVTLSNMQHLRQVIKAQYSTLLVREGVFNPIGEGLTVFVRDRNPAGELEGLMIYDSRPEHDSPITIIAKRGVLVSTETGQQVVVYDGSRQSYSVEDATLARLDFARYTIDLPESSNPVRERWREPDERTLWELVNPDMADADDQRNRREFIVEAHRRIVSPLLAPAFAVIALASLLLGPVDRRGMGKRMTGAIIAVILIESLYLAAFNLSKDSYAGLVLMYALVFIPLGGGFYLLHPASEAVQTRVLRAIRRNGILGGEAPS